MSGLSLLLLRLRPIRTHAGGVEGAIFDLSGARPDFFPGRKGAKTVENVVVSPMGGVTD